MKYKSELNQLLDVANNKLAPLYSRDCHPKPRIILKDNTLVLYFSETTKERELSPKMSISNLCNWLNGFISGLEF
jgi:hypothetical protein